MKTKTPENKLWTCPECGRQFERHGQSHSCKAFPLEKHFEHKPAGRLLFDVLKQAVISRVGAIKIESLECCIHFVSTFTFAAVKILKDKIRVDFSLSRKISNRRIVQSIQMSAHRYLYVIDVMTEDEIDEELMAWIQEAHQKKGSESRNCMLII